MPEGLTQTHVKDIASQLLDRIVNAPFYPDMNDGSVDWKAAYAAMKQTQSEDSSDMASILVAGLMVIASSPTDNEE